MARFKATKVNLMKLCLPLYIQGGDALMRKQALDFAVLLLTSGVGVDVDDITTDPAIINKITWAERRMGTRFLCIFISIPLCYLAFRTYNPF